VANQFTVHELNCQLSNVKSAINAATAAGRNLGSNIVLDPDTQRQMLETMALELQPNPTGSA
jgi:hypothetical protein